MVKINYNKEDIVSHRGVAAVIRNKQGEILMQEHAKYGFWTIPVGKVKSGQKIEDGLREEIKEETNLSIREFKELKFKKFTYIRNGNKVEVLSHLFEILDYGGAVKNNEPQKHRKQLFLPLAKIKKLPYLSDLTLLYLGTLGIKRKAQLASK
jgi:8-oxo-dGTP diphosphatase